MASDQETLRPGTVYAGYQVVRILGEGGFGAVYEARKPGAARAVALKVLRAEVSGNEEIVTRFLREAQAVAKLHHPNIVEAVEMGEFEDRPFLAMELLEGESLNERLAREAPMDLQRALDLMLPVMSAMRCAHEHGIVHRDLKPDNVFVTRGPDGGMRPKVLDFGFAKMAQPGIQLTRNDTAIGTPNFMSPEQLHSPRAVDPRSDQWGLAVLLYYALTGVKPFAGDKLVETLKNVLHSEPVALRRYRPDLPYEVEATISRALTKNPDGRFGSVQEMAATLIPFASDETAMAHTAEFVGDIEWQEEEEPATNPALVSQPPQYAEPQYAQQAQPPYAQHAPYAQPTPPPPRSVPSSGPQSIPMLLTIPRSMPPQPQVAPRPARGVAQPTRIPRAALAIVGAAALGAVVAVVVAVVNSRSERLQTDPHTIVPSGDAAVDAPDARAR